MADAVIGTDASDCLILASHPEERMLPGQGKPSLVRRTLVLKCDGHRARFVAALPHPLIRAWTSSAGAGYAAPVRGNYVCVHDRGQWNTEQFSEADEQITHLWGWSGDGGSAADTVYLSTRSGLYIRSAGRWTLQQSVLPPQPVYGVHGIARDEIYVCAESGLLLWDGVSLAEVDTPPGPLAKWICVRPQEIVCGGDVMSCWSEVAGWTGGDPPLRDVMSLVDVQGQLVIGTYEHGIFEGSCTDPVQVTPDFKCMSVQALNNGAFARDKQQGWMRLDGAWHPLVMPIGIAGGTPIDPP